MLRVAPKMFGILISLGVKIRPFPLTLHAGLTTVQRYRASYDRNSLQIAFGFSVYIYFRNFGIFMPPSSALCDLGKLHSRKEMFLPSFFLGTIEKNTISDAKGLSQAARW